MKSGKKCILCMLVITLLVSSLGMPALAVDTFSEEADNDNSDFSVQETAILHKESNRIVTTDTPSKTVTISNGASHKVITSTNDIEVAMKDLSYYFEADTEYTVRVSFFDPKEQSGDIKITIIPASGYDEYGEFYDLYDYTRGVTWSLSRYYVKLLTFEYSSPQDLTMRVTSDIDTVLYIVDPRSTELLTEALWATTRYYDNLYCDDYDDDTYDPKITKSVEANVPYLVIVSAYNPSSSTSVGDFYLNFE